MSATVYESAEAASYGAGRSDDEAVEALPNPSWDGAGATAAARQAATTHADANIQASVICAMLTRISILSGAATFSAAGSRSKGGSFKSNLSSARDSARSANKRMLVTRIMLNLAWMPALTPLPVNSCARSQEREAAAAATTAILQSTVTEAGERGPRANELKHEWLRTAKERQTPDAPCRTGLGRRHTGHL